jgi:hypothetical protein
MQDWRDVTVWQRLAAEGEALVDAADEALAPGEAMAAPSAIARLRKTHDAAMVAAAFELVAARRKARAKFASADTLWCDVAGVEQASDETVAAWKAARLVAALGSGAAILDLCCGIGGDAIAMSEAGLSVTAIDRDPRRAWMAARNARCECREIDVEDLDLAGAVLHADPARREERSGIRSLGIEDYQPGREWILRALRDARAAAIKLSPALDRRSLPADLIEWELVEVDGILVQGIAWGGALTRRQGGVRATTLRAGALPHTIVGTPDDLLSRALPVDSNPAAGAWISEPCSALERARLLTSAIGAIRAHELGGGVGLVASLEPLPAPWFESFVIVGSCEARPADIARLIADAGLRARSVRVRGQAGDADQLTRTIGCHPAGNAVVFLWRERDRPRAIVARTA